MKQVLIGFGMLCFFFQLKAQTVTLVDKATSEPIRYATLSSEIPPAFELTNSKGQVNLSPFKGASKITISSFGHQTIKISYDELLTLGDIIQLENSNLNLSEVVISGNRWSRSSENLPTKIISISPEEIAFQNPQTAADLLGVSGKVYIQKSQQGGGSPMIRGFATNRLLYVVDGIRMNTAIFRGGNIQNVINLDPFAMEHAEVLFGPGSVIYGSDAVGGVMSFNTLTPKFSLDENASISGNAITRYSSANNESTGHLDLNVGWKKWAISTSISAWDYDHLRQGSNGPDDYLKPFYVKRINEEDVVIPLEDGGLRQIPSAYSQLNLMQKVRFKPSQAWDFQYGFHYSETSPYGRYDRHNRIRNGLPRYAEWDYGPQIWMMNNLSITHFAQRGAFDQMSIRLAHQHFEESRIDRDLNKPIRTTQNEKVTAFSINTDFTKILDANNTLVYGAEWVLNEVYSNGMITNIISQESSPGPSRYPRADWRSFGVYINEEHKLNEQVNLQAGLRYNWFGLDARFDTSFYPFPFTEANLSNGALTGSIGGVYRPNDSWVISSNFGTAFRSPNVDDIGKVFDSEPGAVTVPNPDLEAEYAYSLDLGVAKKLSDFAKLDVTGYYTLLNNALVRRDFTLAGNDSIIYQGELSKVQAIQNAAQARVYGLQIGLEIKMNDHLSFSSDLNIQSGEEELDNGAISPSRHAAPLFGISRLTYRKNKLQVQLYASYQGEKSFDELPVEERAKREIYAKDSDGKTFAPSWYTLNFKTSYPIFDFLILNAGIENITDQRYRPFSSGISGPGRNIQLSLKASF
ncbi:TonB-dependent receptor [Algoriphagus sp. NBT04N3]|jgi:hemoglobin/transferrin/lactoferrin receptor protein|uniref:TonB-dependent receptor plug domain-containing protein n=1 Tax=Algoriphagus sp. NBT04N3 TaxID=2705473 RepID=UPI001C626830|nr:TonB-dependent receptor [Algoriphagus sp. NBT04N3]QYH39327.1 TonB-dependent receptor [Algoriphagus sp. NBT04N3]